MAEGLMVVKEAHKRCLLDQGFSPASTVSVIQSIIIEAIARGDVHPGISAEEDFFHAFLEAEKTWKMLVEEFPEKLGEKDIISEIKEVYPKGFSRWLEWRKEHRANEKPLV